LAPVCLFSAPVVSEETITFIQQLINGLSLGATYALVALGYTMVYGVLRFINFAHGDIFMLGAFTGLFAAPKILPMFTGQTMTAETTALELQPHYGGATLVLLIAMVLCAIIGMTVERLCYRPLRERPKITVLITAIGVSLFLESFGQFKFGATPQAFPTLIEDTAIVLPESWGALTALTVTKGQVLGFGTTIVLLIVLTFVVLKTKIGMAMRALAFNPTACALMGVNINWVIGVTFGIGSALAGAAGILNSIQQPSVEPLMGVSAGLKAFVAAVLGGIGNFGGAVLGGLLLGVVETLVVGYGFPTYRDAVAFAVLILILLLRPAGLLGKNVREKV
jgi:branched-chain amino acid transport system permease protein